MPPDSPPPCLNIEEAIENIGGDRELFFDTVLLFLDDVMAQLASFEAALVAGDYVSARRAAHTVKGNSASLGAVRLRHSAMIMEKACESSDTAAIAAAKPAFHADVAETVAEFRKHLPSS